MPNKDWFSRSHIVRASIVEVGASIPKLDDLIWIFKNSPPAPLLHALSSLSIHSAHNSIRKTDNFLKHAIFSKQTLKSLNHFESEQGTKTIVFSEMALLFLFDLCRKFSPTENNQNLTAEELSSRLSNAFLIANYFINQANTQLDGHSREKYARFAIREGIFNENDQFRYMLGRSKLIFDTLRGCVLPESKRFNVPRYFEENFQFSLDDYFKCIVSIYSHFQQNRPDRDFIEPDFIDPETFFSKASNSEGVGKVLRHLTQDWDNSASFSLFDENDHDSTRDYFYQHFGAKSKPLIKFENRIYPISLKYLEQLCWTGPYYLVINEMNKKGHTPDPLFHFLGETTELYTKRLLQYSFSHKYSVRPTRFKNPLGDCTLRINPRFRLVFEVKGKRPNVDAISGDLPLIQNKSVKMMFTEPMTQLSDRIMEFRHENKGLIVPVLITMGSLNINELNWPEYFELVKHLPIFSDKKVTLPIFLDAETLEILCALGQHGHSLSKVVKGKLRSRWINADFKTYLYDGYFKSIASIEPINRPVADATTEIFNELSKELFGKSIATEQSNWRSVFEVNSD